MKKLCAYFKKEISGELFDAKYDGVCLKRRKGDHVSHENCIKGGRCKSWASAIPEPQPKKEHRYFDDLPF